MKCIAIGFENGNLAVETNAITLGIADEVTKIGYTDYKALYLDWLNNFSTVAGFAEHHHISDDLAENLINNAKELYHCK